MAYASHHEAILSCIRALRDCFPSPFVLIGGAAIISIGSRRTTEDVDILVPSETNLREILADLQTINGISIENGILCFKSEITDSVLKVDILTTIVQRATFEDLGPNTTMLNGVRILKLDFALAVKIHCWYLRAEDDNGERKRRSDASDIVFLGRRMIQFHEEISDECVDLFRIGYYHMIELRINLEVAQFKDLMAVGIRKLLIPWEENTAEQRDYYLFFASEGTDPLTVPLDDE